MFDTSTFLSVWYWIFCAFFWSLISNWTFGVSKWALNRAKTSDEDRKLAATLGRRSIARAVRQTERPPLFDCAVQAFLVAAVLTLAVLRKNEMAQGLAFLAVPMCGFAFWRVFEARRLHESELDDEALLKRISQIRFFKQVMGTISLGAAVAFGLWMHLGDIKWHYSG